MAEDQGRFYKNVYIYWQFMSNIIECKNWFVLTYPIEMELIRSIHFWSLLGPYCSFFTRLYFANGDEFPIFFYMCILSNWNKTEPFEWFLVVWFVLPYNVLVRFFALMYVAHSRSSFLPFLPFWTAEAKLIRSKNIWSVLIWSFRTLGSSKKNYFATGRSISQISLYIQHNRVEKLIRAHISDWI